MAQIIPEGFAFVARGDRTRREAASELLAQADKAGVDRQQIRVTNGGYYVPEELVGDSKSDDSDSAPAKTASKGDWVAYAAEQGYDESEGLTKDELIERYGG